jgi:hypothetical protein
MISTYIQEQKRYSRTDLEGILQCKSEELDKIIWKLKKHSIITMVRKTIIDGSFDDSDFENEFTDYAPDIDKFYIVFSFVGVIVISERVIYCFPKYIRSKKNLASKMKQIFFTLRKYQSRFQNMYMPEGSDNISQSSIISLMLNLINDYHENGTYFKTINISEHNGNGEILWDKTINNEFPFIKSNRPYYLDYFTRRNVSNNSDYFKKLHEFIITFCSNELTKHGLIDLFGVVPAIISDSQLEDFGEIDQIIVNLKNEISIQYDTHRNIVLNMILSLLLFLKRTANVDSFQTYGTNSFNLVWEHVCSKILGNILGDKIVDYVEDFEDKQKTIIDLIEKPTWHGFLNNNVEYSVKAKGTLIPDIVSLNFSIDKQLIIFDAKYYRINMNSHSINGQPGIGDITKQYLYQLSLKHFIDALNIDHVRNCFLVPIDENEICNKGYVDLSMMSGLGLKEIQVRGIPAELAYQLYLENDFLKVKDLKL